MKNVVRYQCLPVATDVVITCNHHKKITAVAKSCKLI